MTERKPLMEGWVYEVSGVGTFVTLAGHRPDTPGGSTARPGTTGLPLVVSSGRTEAEAVENLKVRAHEWDRQAFGSPE